MDRQSGFVEHELEKLSETILAMESLRDDFLTGSISRRGGFYHYSNIMKTASAIIKVRSDHPSFIPESYIKTIEAAKSYTQSVQGDLMREICKSPIAAWNIVGIPSGNLQVDKKISLYFNYLDYVRSYTEKIQKLQDKSNHHYYPIDTINTQIDLSIQYIMKAARLWSDTMTAIDAHRGNINKLCINHVDSIASHALLAFMMCVNKHIDTINHSIEQKIQQSTRIHTTDYPKKDDYRVQIMKHNKTINELITCVDSDISYLTRNSDNVDIEQQINTFSTHSKQHTRLYSAYNILTTPFTHTVSYAKHPGSEASGSI